MYSRMGEWEITHLVVQLAKSCLTLRNLDILLNVLASVPALPHKHFHYMLIVLWEENIEKSGKGWAQISREVDVR